MDVELPADQQAHGGGEPGVGLHDLGRLLLDDEGAGDQGGEQVGHLGVEGREAVPDGRGGADGHLHGQVLHPLDLLPVLPDQLRQGLAPVGERRAEGNVKKLQCAS